MSTPRHQKFAWGRGLLLGLTLALLTFAGGCATNDLRERFQDRPISFRLGRGIRAVPVEDHEGNKEKLEGLEPDNEDTLLFIIWGRW